MITARERLEQFIHDLNILDNERIMFANIQKKNGFFELKIEEGIRDGKDAVRIGVCYTDADLSHPIYMRTSNMPVNDMCIIAYFELLRMTLFGVDSIGVLADEDGRNLNVLTFQTIIKEGLKKLKTT